MELRENKVQKLKKMLPWCG